MPKQARLALKGKSLNAERQNNMGTQDNNSLEVLIRQASMLGKLMYDNNNNLLSTPAPLFVNSSGQLSSSVEVPYILSTGAATTATSVLAVRGQATGSANDLMHLTLVKGSNATATIAGYMRITVTDDAGVIVTGDYYAPFYTLA